MLKMVISKVNIFFIIKIRFLNQFTEIRFFFRTAPSAAAAAGTLLFIPFFPLFLPPGGIVGTELPGIFAPGETFFQTGNILLSCKMADNQQFPGMSVGFVAHKNRYFTLIRMFQSAESE